MQEAIIKFITKAYWPIMITLLVKSAIIITALIKLIIKNRKESRNE